MIVSSSEGTGKSYEMRRALRVSFTRPFADFSLVQLGVSPAPAVLKGKVLDLSDDGMCMKVDEDEMKKPGSPSPMDFEAGTVVQARVGVSVVGVRVNLPVMGQIVWTRRTGDEGHRVGIRFII